jgi:murein DD-endopeptidase MepM/ murein hydrolase activator NlpD
MPKLWDQAKQRFTGVINSRMVALNVLVLFTAILLVFLSLSAVALKPPQPAVSITAIADPTTDPVSAAPATTVAASEQPSLPASKAAVVAVDKPWREDERPQRPLAGEVSLAYGWQFYPQFNDWRYHTGMDIAAAPGQSVTAVLSGIVITSGEAKQTGLTVVISSGRRQISYGCLSRTTLSVGQKIAQGEVVGFTGQSQAEPDPPHLHIGFKLDDEYQDPQKLFE